MSYDLWFWNQNNNCSAPPDQIMTAFCEENDSADAIEIDINAILADVIKKFPGIEQHMDPETGKLRQLILDPKDQDWVLLLSWTNKYLCVESHGAPGEILNEFIDICWPYGMPLYDPQTGERYTG